MVSIGTKQGENKYLEILRQGVDTWNIWKKNHPNEKINLNETNLIGADLVGINLSQANLIKINLQTLSHLSFHTMLV